MADHELVVLDDADEVGREAARRAIAALAAGIAERGASHLGLTGGSSAVPFFKALRLEGREAIDWAHVHLWWVDERFVPTDHPDSNAGATYRLLLAMTQPSAQSAEDGSHADVAGGALPALPIDPGHVHPVEVDETLGDDNPVELAAQLYARELNRFVPLGHGGVPRFDVLTTGVGPDGHIFSLFPGSPGLLDDAPITLGVPAPAHVEPHVARVSLSARVLPAARLVLVMSSGAGKADIMTTVLGADTDVARWPAQAAALPNAVWLIDRAAAAKMPDGRLR